MVDSYTEEVTGPEYPFKYGVTQYEWRFNQVAVFDDGSKEILNSNIETRFNQSNYHATDDELRAETEENISRHMAYYQEVLRLVNEERAKVGVGPLTLDLTMCKNLLQCVQLKWIILGNSRIRDRMETIVLQH